MLIKNVKANWIYLNSPDEQDCFRVTIEVSKEQDAVIQEALQKILIEKGKKPEKAGWELGSRKVSDDGVITYQAKTKAQFKNKKGEMVEKTVPVYNIKAQCLQEIPMVANGAIINLVIEPYYAEYLNRYGASLGLQSVQLIDYKVYESANQFVDESVDNQFTNEAFNANPDDIF